jgi:hypothetical protein
MKFHYHEFYELKEKKKIFFTEIYQKYSEFIHSKYSVKYQMDLINEYQSTFL